MRKNWKKSLSLLMAFLMISLNMSVETFASEVPDETEITESIPAADFAEAEVTEPEAVEAEVIGLETVEPEIVEDEAIAGENEEEGTIEDELIVDEAVVYETPVYGEDAEVTEDEVEVEDTDVLMASASEETEPEIVDSGTYDGLTWTLDSEGTLTVEGSGALPYRFYNCVSGGTIRNVIIKDGVTSITHQAFYGCSSLESITIPNSVTSIESSAFNDCSNLESITLPNSVTSIGSFAFEGCRSLESITIPNSVTSIGNDAFEGCSSLESITIPKNVTSMSWSIFENCDKLKTAGPIGSGSNIEFGWTTTIPGYAFSGCSSLESITLPSSVTSIGWDAFSGCSSLESITLPSGVTSIGRYAFYGCTSLESITIPKNVTTIGSETFKGCINLTSVSFPSGLEEIDSSAFSQCTSLSEITLPATVKTINREAFSACTNLEIIVISCNVATMGSNIFAGCTNLTIYGYQNSEAQKYATANDIPFVSLGKFVTVKFDAGDSGYVGWDESQRNVVVGEKYGTLPVVKPYYSSREFNGWYTKKTGGTKVTESTICDGTITTLYAQYTYYVTVNFDAGEGGKLSSSEAQKTLAVGKTYGTLPSVKSNSSCKFNGWYTKRNGGTKVTESTICDGTITTLYAQYTTYTTATKLTQATSKTDGEIVTYYTYNNQAISRKTIKKISGVTLKYSSTVYTGASLKPAVTVKDSDGNVISSSYYTVAYSNNKNVGTATVTVKFSGNYSGTLKKTFTIVPKPTKISKLTGGKQKMTVNWKKQATQTTGYQIQYSTNKNFSKAKTVTASSAKTVSKNITKLSAKKTYYVRIRTYKKIGKTYYYSKWSAASKVKTK